MVVDVQLNANVYVKSKLEYESQKDNLLIWRQPRPRPLARHVVVDVVVDVVLPVAVGVVSSHITITMQMSLTMTMASPSAAHRAYCYICLTDIYLND